VSERAFGLVVPARSASRTRFVNVYSLPVASDGRGGRRGGDELQADGGTLANERNTEAIVRDHLKNHGVDGMVVDEQIPSIARVKAALKEASKRGTGVGKPEFIVTFVDALNLIIVVECKADPKFHESAGRDRPADYAVDGVLHYAAFLAAKKFDVVALAVSGTSANDLRVSTFRQLAGAPAAELLPSPHGPVDRLIPVAEYRKLLDFDPAVRARTQAELMAYSRKLHNFMRDYAKLSEAEKPLIVSGILLALKDRPFKHSWRDFDPEKDLAPQLFGAIERTAKAADFRERKREIMLAPYAFITTHPELSRVSVGGNSPLFDLIDGIEQEVAPFLDVYNDVDVIGQFYGEFLRYTGGDKKGLGIVLTPRHITDLFARIANVGVNDVVVDTCAGTGGFLIASMAIMDQQAGVDAAARENIRKHQLIGVEQQPHMFALAASNMILRGDGKANLYQGSCFNLEIQERLRDGVKGQHSRPTVGLINPPFSQKGEGLHELDFAEALLDVLVPGGTAVIVAPMSCAIEVNHPVRERLLKKHTLVAVMSLPNDLFSPVGTIACAMVLRAHQPHQHSPQPTWFGYWKEDGFVKTKDRGRIDLNHTWPAIRDEWLAAFHGRSVVPGRSVARKVTATDEWCAEAYMETDYSVLSQSQFEATLRRFAVFQLLNVTEDESDDLGATD